MTQKTPKKNAVAEALLALAEAIKNLEAKIDGKSQASAEPAIGQPDKAESSGRTVAPESPMSQYPFPFEWREVIDTVLNKAFKAEVVYRGDGQFELSIFVPRQYSNAKPGHWDLVHSDQRVAVINNALGTAGVREFVEKISKNLGPEIMQSVQDDRLKLVHA